MFQHGYILDVQILSINELKIFSPIWLIEHIRIVFLNSIHICIPYKICTLLLMILKMKSPFITQLIIEMEIKSKPNSNVENNEKIHIKNGETLKVKRGCYTMKDIERVSSGKVKYDSLTGKSVIDSCIRRFGP